MAGQRGRDVLIMISDGGAPETFVSVAGIRARTISLSAGLIDGTTAQSPQAWRELIAGAGTKRAEVAGSGVFKGRCFRCTHSAGVLQRRGGALATGGAGLRRVGRAIRHQRAQLCWRSRWRGDVCHPVDVRRRGVVRGGWGGGLRA